MSVDVSTRRGVGAKRADIAFSWARSGIAGEGCGEDSVCDAGGGCGEDCCAFCAEAKATAQSRSTIAGMSVRMGKR